MVSLVVRLFNCPVSLRSPFNEVPKTEIAMKQ